MCPEFYSNQSPIVDGRCPSLDSSPLTLRATSRRKIFSGNLERGRCAAYHNLILALDSTCNANQMIVCLRGAKNHSFPDFREPCLELVTVMALFTPHQTTPNPTKTYSRAHILGQKQKKGHATQAINLKGHAQSVMQCDAWPAVVLVHGSLPACIV